MRCPRDPPARPLPGTLKERDERRDLHIHNNPLPTNHIMGARTGIIGEHIVPCHWPRYLMFSGKYRCRLYFFSRQMSRHDMTFRLFFLRQISRQDTTLHALIKEYFSARAAHAHTVLPAVSMITLSSGSACCSAASRLPV